MLVGAIIGIERELKNKPAGLRTHMLVSFGAALLTLIPLLVDENELNSDALSRVIQGIQRVLGF